MAIKIGSSGFSFSSGTLTLYGDGITSVAAITLALPPVQAQSQLPARVVWPSAVACSMLTVYGAGGALDSTFSVTPTISSLTGILTLTFNKALPASSFPSTDQAGVATLVLHFLYDVA